MEKPTKLGRPPKKAEDRHDASPLYIKLTTGQRIALNAAAESAGQPITVWARELLLHAAKRIGAHDP